MAYTDVLSLATAKTYLKVEHTDSDTEITAMINAAGEWIEKQTNHILYSRNITYRLSDKNCINVYDYPITAVVKGIDKDGADVTLTFETNYNVSLKALHNVYVDIDSSADQLVLTVGYESAASVPANLVEAMKIIVKALYYSHDAETIDDAIPLVGKTLINNYRRFYV